MKVYVVKNDKNEYMTETGDFIKSLWQAELFDDLETACCYTPTDCNVVECALMTPTEFQDYTKQVRNEVVQEIWKEFEQRLMNKTQDMPIMKVANMINSVLDQIQGEKNDNT